MDTGVSPPPSSILSNIPTTSGSGNTQPQPHTPSSSSGGGVILTTPAVRRIAKENSIDLRQVQGTGPKGRVLKADVLAYMATGGSSSGMAATGTTQPSTTTATGAVPSSGSITVPIRGVQRLMVKSMQAANEVKTFTYGEEIKMDALTSLRKQLQLPAKEKFNVTKLSYMPLILKVRGLKKRVEMLLRSLRCLLLGWVVLCLSGYLWKYYCCCRWKGRERHTCLLI